ncbi:SCO family protein [Advenella mimigardefordensis]|nr:hypothetical protein [Advenella mimigardefordensis]
MNTNSPSSSGTSSRSGARRSNMPLYLIILSCIVPIVAAALLYYVPSLRPAGSTNYGNFVQPQRPMPSAEALSLTTLDGKPFDLNTLKGKWLLLTSDGGACPDSCAQKLHFTRNGHASQGKNVSRIQRVWFVTDDQPIPEKVLEAYKGTIMLRVDPKVLGNFLLDQADREGDAVALEKKMDSYLWIVDPNGNLIMHYPGNESDPVRFRDDLAKLLHASSIG